MIRLFIATSLIFSAAIAQAKPDTKARKPASISSGVMIGGEADLDACGGFGIVLATTTLMTYKAGQVGFDKVDVNTMVSSCDESSDGRFFGIVFGKKGQDCKVSSPVPKRQEYQGPCKSGWIKKEFFEQLAG